MFSGSPYFPWRMREWRHRYRPFVPSQRSHKTTGAGASVSCGCAPLLLPVHNQLDPCTKPTHVYTSLKTTSQFPVVAPLYFFPDVIYSTPVQSLHMYTPPWKQPVSFLWLRPFTSSRTWSTRPLYKAYTCIHQLENNHPDYGAPSHTHADISDAGSLASLHSCVRRALPTQLGVAWQQTVASVVRWSEVWNLPALGRVYGPQLCRSLVLVLVERAQPEQEHCWIHERELSSRFYLCRLCTAFYGRVLRAQAMGRNIPRIRCKVDLSF